MIYHCVACPGGPCHADPPTARRCPQGHAYRWVECDCKAEAEMERDERVYGGQQISAEALALFQRELVGGA